MQAIDGLTPAEFAAKIKAKYPQYVDIEDSVLVEKILEKYPEYKSKITFDTTPEVPKEVVAEASGDSASPSAGTDSSLDSSVDEGLKAKDSASPSAGTDSSLDSSVDEGLKVKDEAARRIQKRYEEAGVTEYEINDEDINREVEATNKVKHITASNKPAKKLEHWSKAHSGFIKEINNPELYKRKKELEAEIASRPIMANNTDIQSKLDEVNATIERIDAPKQSESRKADIAIKGLEEKQFELEQEAMEAAKSSDLSYEEILTGDGNYQDILKQKSKLKDSKTLENAVLNKIKEDTNSSFGTKDLFTNAARYFGYSDKSEQTIKLSEEVSEEILLSLTENQKEKMARGFTSLDEKEAIIGQAKGKVINRTTEKFKQRERDVISSDLEDTEKVNKIKENTEEYNEFLGQIGYDVAGDILNNQFKKTDARDNFNESVVKKGFLGDVATPFLTFFDEGAKLVLKGTAGWGSAFASVGDIFMSDDHYSSYDAFGDVVGQFTDQAFLPNTKDERFSLRKEDGSLRVTPLSVLNTVSRSAGFTVGIALMARRGGAGNIERQLGQFINPTKSVKFTNDLKLMESAYGLTLSDNYREAKRLGLDGLSAAAYTNTLSMIEGITEPIMRDTKFFETTGGTAILKQFQGDLKSATNRKLITESVKRMSKNVKNEFIEEDIVLAVQDLTKFMLVAEHENSEFWDIRNQLELGIVTTGMSGIMGTISMRNNIKADNINIYKAISKDINGVVDNLLKAKEGALTPEAAEGFTKTIEWANNMNKAIKLAPANVTGEQIDLLMEKANLVTEMKSLDPAFHAQYKEKIEAIDAKINPLNKKTEEGVAKAEADIAKRKEEAAKKKAAADKKAETKEPKVEEVTPEDKKPEEGVEDVDRKSKDKILDDITSSFKTEGDKEFTKDQSEAFLSAAKAAGIKVLETSDGRKFIDPSKKEAIALYNYLGLGNNAKKVETIKPTSITAETSSNFANMTEDGEGNFVFFHRGKKGYGTVKRGTGASRVTSREEAAALGKVGGLAMYYTNKEGSEKQGSDEAQYAVKVAKDKVYDFNNDALNLIDEARELHKKEHPDKAFDRNTQVAYVAKIAGNMGFEMVVAEWAGTTRAQTTSELAPTDVRETDGAQVTKEFKGKYESNKDKGFDSVIPKTKKQALAEAYDVIHNERNKDANYDKAYSLYSESDKYTQDEITKIVEESDLSKESKDAYKEALAFKQGKRKSQIVEKSKATDVKSAPKGHHINVGMVEGKTNKPLTAKQIKDNLPEGVEVISEGENLVDSGSEELTLSLELSRPLTDLEMKNLLKATKQEAIPQLTDGKGSLFATSAETLKDWGGDFNPKFFSMPDGKKVSEGAAKDIDADLDAFMGTPEVESAKAKESRRANVKVLADRAKKSLSRIAPNVKIKIYNTTAEFEAATGDKNTAGKWSPNKGKGGTISINLDYATGRTVAHETVHAVLGTMIKSDKALERLTDKFLGVLAKNVDGDVKVELDNFINLYADKPEVMSEEFAAELGGMLADNYTKLSNKAQGIVKQWLDTIAKKIGLKEFTDSEIIDLLNTIAGKTAKGEVITEADVAILSDGAVITGEIPSGIERKGKESKFIDNLELERLPTHKNIIVKKRFNLRDIAGQVASSTLSDKLVAGRLGKFLLYGGVGYPEATGLLWAASNKTSADKITNKIKKSKDGFNYLMPAIMSNVSHMSNKDMTVVAIETLKEASKNGEIDLASLTASIEKAFGNKSLLKLQEGALNAIEGKTNINETLDALLDYIFTPKFTFVKRRNLLQSIIGDAKSQKPKYSTVGTFTKLAGSLAEPLVKDSEIYEVNVVYRTKGTLRTVKIAKTDPRYHKSYPFAVESSEKIEVLHLVEGYNLVDIFPEFTKADGDKKSLKQELEDKLGEYTEKYIRTNHGRTHGLSSYSAPIVADKPIRREMSQRTDKASEKLVSLFDRDNVPLTIPEAKEMVNEVLDWADWYDGLSGYVNKVFGEYGSDVLSILPLASMGNGSAGTVTMAINNVEKIYKGERPSGLAEYYNFVTDFLEGKGIKSDKMYNFFKALLGDPNAVAVDMHVYSIIKWKDSNKKQVNPANKKEFAKAKEFVNTLAKELGMQPREVQASLWALNILRTGGKPDSYEQYIEKHIKEKNLYQRVESWREQGYKPFSEVREAKEREQIGERKEKSQKVGIGYFKSKPAANVRSGNKAFRDAVEAKREAKRLEREANIKRIEKLQKEIEGSPAKSVEEVVQFSRDKGYEDTVIKDALLKRGFSKEQIETALATIIPTAIVKGAAKAVRDNKKSNLKADVDAVGIDHVKSTKWYRGLTVKQKDALNKKGISNILADKELALRKGSQPTKAGKKFRDTVKDVTGQTDTSAEVTTTKAKLLKEKMKTLARGARIGAKGMKDLKTSFIKEISIELKSLTKSKIMTLTEARKVLAAVNQLNFKNYDKVSELVDKVIAEIENKGVLRQIKGAKASLRKGSKSERNPVNMRELAKDAIKVNERYLTPARRVRYANLLGKVQAGFKLANSKGYKLPSEAGLITALEVLNNEAETARLLEIAENLGVDGTGLTRTQLIALVEAVDVDAYLDTLSNERAKEARAALETQAEYVLLSLRYVDGTVLTGYDKNYAFNLDLSEQERKDVRMLKTVELGLLSSTDIRDLIKIVDNIVTNQTFASSGNLMSKIRSYNASEKATKEFNKGNTKMIDKSVITDLKSLALVFKSVFQSTRAAALFDKISGLTNLGIAYTKHKKAMNALAKSYDELFAKLLKNHKGLNKPESTMFRGLVAQLIQGTTSEDFDINTSRVKDHINKIKNGAQKQSTRLGLEVLEEQYEALKGLKSQEEVIEYAKGLKDGNWELVEFWMNHFDANKDALKYNTEVVHGKSFEEVVGNYLPIKLKADGTATEDVDNQAFFDRNGLPATNPSVTTISRTKTKKLPPNRVLDLDFDSVMFNKAAGVSIDIETSAAYKDVYNFFNSPNMKKMFGKETIGVFQKKLTEMRKVQLGISSMDVNKDETIKAVNKVERIWKTIATTIGLGSVTQYPKQYISVAFNAMAHLGSDSGLMFKAMFTDKSKIPLLDMVSVSLRGETQAGTITGGTRISEAEKKATKAVVGRVVQETGLAAEKVREVLFYSLRKGDVNVAKSSWIAFYQKYLKDNNITDVDMATEHERMDEDIRQEAIAYAELKVEETQISSDESRGSEFYQSKETSRAILRGIFLPYQSFNINSKMRMLTDIRIIGDRNANAEHRRDAGASLLGTAAEMITFQTMKYYVLAPIIGLGKAALMSLFGLDEPEEEEWDAEHKSKQFKFKQWYSALSKDLNPLAIGSFAEDMVIETLNLMQYFAEAKDGEAYVDYIKRLRDEGGGQMFYRYKDKEERGKGFGASLLGGGGLYSIPYSQFSETLDAYELMMDNTRRDDWGNLFEYNFTENQQLMLKFAFAAEFISLFGLGEADSRRLLRNMRKDAQKNTEKKKIN